MPSRKNYVRSGAGYKVHKLRSMPDIPSKQFPDPTAEWYAVERSGAADHAADLAHVSISATGDSLKVTWHKGGACGAFFLSATVGKESALDAGIARALQGPTTWRTGPFQQPIR